MNDIRCVHVWQTALAKQYSLYWQYAYAEQCFVQTSDPTKKLLKHTRKPAKIPINQYTRPQLVIYHDLAMAPDTFCCCCATQLAMASASTWWGPLVMTACAYCIQVHTCTTCNIQHSQQQNYDVHRGPTGWRLTERWLKYRLPGSRPKLEKDGSSRWITYKRRLMGRILAGDCSIVCVHTGTLALQHATTACVQ